MSVPDEVQHDAEKTGELVRKKLMKIETVASFLVDSAVR